MDKLSLTPTDIWTALLAVLAFAGALVTIGKAVEYIKSWKKPQRDLRSDLDQCLLSLGKAHSKDDQHDKEIAALNQGLIVTCKGVKALLEHELHNGNTSEMLNASKAIDNWLFSK